MLRKSPALGFVTLVLVLLLAAFPACDGDESSPSTDDDDTIDDANDDDDDTNNDAIDDDDDTIDDDNDDNDTDDDDDDDDDNDTTPPENDDWRYMWDDQGRAIIFHGCNLDGSAKGASGLPAFTREEVLTLSEQWGFNFARYLIFWARIEPEMGVYDEDYLDEVEIRLDWAHEAGLKVVLDMHQDLWGPFVGSRQGEGSDGAPEWATITDGWPHIPFDEIFGGWAFNYLSPAINRAFDNFWAYDRHPELQDHFAAMWAHVAERFGDHPAVIGYDPLNESWQGTNMFRYQEFDQTLYSDFNERVINAIREVDADNWIFYEPCAFATNQGLPNHLRALSDPRPGEPRLAYFPHLYSAFIDLLGGYRPEVDHTLTLWEAFRRAEGERQRAPLFAGEWAMLSWFDEENRTQWNDEALRMFERVTAGWAYWDCGSLKHNSEAHFFDLVTSAYPRVVAGFPTSYGYDPDTRTLTLEFDDRPGASGPTEIFIPAERDYPDGFDMEVDDPPDTWTSQWDADSGVLSIWTDPTLGAHVIRIVPN
ncbi:MAG: cellulase family glycosylhydrolase [Candidatus Lernaella stagnicola]|nr:cellulase family glycosylhydrolase [Candidatus Lernaella stagnicola]